jgi:hypothetical protein
VPMRSRGAVIGRSCSARAATLISSHHDIGI